MKERIVFFEGGIDANLWLFLVDILIFVLFIISWYKFSYKKGYKVDFWHFSLLLPIVITCLIMYPFAGSAVNGITIGSAMDLVVDKVDFTFILFCFVFIFLYIGFFTCTYQYRKIQRPFLLKFFIKINNTGKEIITSTINFSPSFYFLVIILLLETCSLILFSYNKFGFAFNYRDLLLKDKNLLTIFNIWNASFIAIFSLIVARFLKYRSLKLIFISLFLILLCILTGSRMTFLLTFLNTFIFYLIAQKKKIHLSRYFLLSIPLLFLFFLIGNLRSDKEFSDNEEFMLFSFFYGNNFSDLRDSAWILATWNDELMWGKSYLAGILGFIPSSIIEFREKFNLSSYTNELMGLDTRIHPGVRPIIGIEPFLNFGYVGLFINSFLIGYCNRLVDLEIKENLKGNKIDYVNIYALSFLNMIALRFYNTGGFWLIYVYLIFIFIGLSIKYILKSVKKA